MAELEISRYNLPKKRKINRWKNSSGFTKYDFFVRMVGFFLAMAMPYGGMAPFGLSFLAQERKISVKAVVSLLSVSVGSMVACDRLGAAKYISAGVIYLALLFILEKGVKLNDFTAGLSAGLCVFMTGLVAIYWQGFGFLDMLLLLCETVAVIAGAIVIDKSSVILQDGTILPERMGSDEKLSLAAIVAISVLSLKEIYIGVDFSVMNTAATAVLLIISAGCGVRYSTGAGVILGVLCGIGSDYFLPVVGAFSFCGFLSGVFSKFGKGGVVAGVVLANAMLVVYTNSAMESVLTLYEIMAASVLFSFVKPKLILWVKTIICLDDREKENIIKVKEGIICRLIAVAAAFESMAKTLEKLSDKEKEENRGDIAWVFDMAADKVCKKCRKASVCWNKELDATYNSLFKLMESMERKGVLDTDDVDDRFRAKCLNLPKLVAELNHQLDIHRVRCVWRSRLAESRELVGEQLWGMSKIIDDLSNEIEQDRINETLSADNIRARLDERGIKVRDMNVLRNRDGRYRVEITMKSGVWKDEAKDEIKKIMKDILDREIKIQEMFFDDGKLVKVEICEAERFCVETEQATKSASEENGDNYRFSHISGGKYVIALSDGMGTGSRAARESQAMLELLDSFLRAGFDSRMAVKFINSVMLLKSEDDAFVTIDICIIDLYTGKAEFIKTGAEPSFIMQKDCVETVRAASLPVGVIADMEAETASRSIDDGDMIVMVTDGIETRESGSLWVQEFIEENCRNNQAHNIADKILERAIEKNSGKVNDDMTVLSVKLRAVS